MVLATLDVVCPVFREEEVILAFHERLTAVLDDLELEVRARVLYVVDPGGDGTEEILRELARRDERCSLIVLSRRFGHQASLVAGLDFADADAVIMMDTDLQHPPELIPDLMGQFASGADIVQALRTDAPSTSWIKASTSRWFYGALRRLSGLAISPGAADFRLFSRRVVEVFQIEMREQNPFVRGLSTWIGYRLVTVGYEAGDRGAGESKYNWKSLLEFAVRGITSFSKAPIRIAAALGFLMSLISFVYGAFAVGVYVFGSYVPPGWTSTLAAATLVGGIQLFFLGVIAEYVGYIFDEVKARPRYLVDFSAGSAVRRAGNERAADAESHHAVLETRQVQQDSLL